MSAGLDRGPVVGDSNLNLRIQFGYVAEGSPQAKKSPGRNQKHFGLRRKEGF